MIHAIQSGINAALVVVGFVATLISIGLMIGEIIQLFENWRHK